MSYLLLDDPRISPVSQGILLAISGEPVLKPLSLHSCPNESVTFTCRGNNVAVIEWRVEPYTNTDGDLSYIPLGLVEDPGVLTRNSTDNTFLSTLLYFSRISDRLANMTTSLTVKTSGVVNTTNITCGTLRGGEGFSMSATIFLQVATDVWKSLYYLIC